MPCAVPMAIAKQSTPVFVTKSTTSFGSVYVMLSTPPSSEFPIAPIVPISPSTVTFAA